MPRFLSAVRILSSFLPMVLIHTCKTFFLSGAIHASCLPLGDTVGELRSGLPKSTSRGMSGGGSARAGAAAANELASNSVVRMLLAFMVPSSVGRSVSPKRRAGGDYSLHQLLVAIQ